MNYLKTVIISSALATGLMLQAAPSGAIMVKSHLDSTTMMMGSVSPLNIEVVQDKTTKGRFPLFDDLGRNGYVTMLNDTIEISAAASPDTIDIGTNRVQINYHMLVQVFDSGYYSIPGLHYVVGNDTVVSNGLFLKIKPVNVTADDRVSPMTGVSNPEDSSIFDILPDWLVKFWWVILLIIAVAVLTIYGVRRYRKQGSLLPPKPETPPHIEAMERLQRLKNRKLWEHGHEKEYYTLLTDILRLYLERRFGINAMEMTTNQIMSVLADDKSMLGSNSKIRQVLDMADFVKFAKVRPLPDDNVKAFENAVKFVEDTTPKPETEPESEISQSETLSAEGNDPGDKKKGGEV